MQVKSVFWGLAFSALASSAVATDALIQLGVKRLTPAFEAADEQKSCVQLDDEIVALVARTYAYKPSFYDDPSNAAAFALGISVNEWFWAWWAVNEGQRYFVSREVDAVEQRIAALRRVKAKKRCFENPY